MGSHKILKNSGGFRERNGQGMQVATESPKTIIEPFSFSKEQLEHLYRLFNQPLSFKSLSSCSLA